MPRSKWRRWRLCGTAILALTALGAVRWPASIAPPAFAAEKAESFDDETARFSIAVNGEVSAYTDTSAFVMPGATSTFEVVGPPGEYALVAAVGLVARRGARAWRWTAPRNPGRYDLRFDHQPGKDSITVHVFVMVPASEVRNGLLNGYRIGAYPPMPPKGSPNYRPPSGFVEVTKDNENTKVSPHFRLKQFLCKQDAAKAYPKYIVLQARLPLKLEAILEEVNALGFHVDTLNVMSAYRTPYYNHAIGDVKYSMHQWGSAADVFIDKANKGVMDDLTRDGRVDTQDSKYLYDVVETMLTRGPFKKFQGGMGFYRGTLAHPPFVHVDVRGTKARWEG